MQQCKYCSAFLLNTTIICNSCGREQRTGSQFAPLLQHVSDHHAPTTVNSSQAHTTQNAQRESSQFQLYHHAHSLPQHSHHLQAAIEHPTIQQYQRHDPARVNVTLLKRSIMSVAVLLIAGSIGMFALMYYTASTPTGTKRNTTNVISSRNSNPTQNVKPGSSPVISTTPTHTTKSTSTTLTCPVNSSHTGNFTFSGAVTGTISLSTFAVCSLNTNACFLSCSNTFHTFQSGGHSYYGNAEGKINGTIYTFEFLINPYLKPDTYTSATNTSVVLMENNHEWESYGVTSNRTSIIVNNNALTGSIHAIISMISPQFDPSNMVMVTGSWSQ